MARTARPVAPAVELVARALRARRGLVRTLAIGEAIADRPATNPRAVARPRPPEKSGSK